MKFFRFCRECNNFEQWLDDKEQALIQKESLSENMEAIKRKYEVGNTVTSTLHLTEHPVWQS